jgi:hypothetical protein
MAPRSLLSTTHIGYFPQGDKDYYRLRHYFTGRFTVLFSGSAGFFAFTASPPRQ